MRREEIEKYIGKKIKIVLKNTFSYTGEIIEIKEDILLFLDKFGNQMTVSIDEIILITENRKEVNSNGDK